MSSGLLNNDIEVDYGDNPVEVAPNTAASSSSSSSNAPKINSAYKAVAGGKLNLKGGSKKSKKKKAKKKKRDEFEAFLERKSAQTGIANDTIMRKTQDTMTEAERKLQEVQDALEQSESHKRLKKTHRERIDEYNAKLGAEPMHFDLPRVGPG